MQGSTNSTGGSSSIAPTPSYEQIVNYTMLYDAGDECTEVTGGIRTYSGGTTYNGVTTAVTKNSDHIYCESVNGTGGAGSQSAIFTANAINLTEYSKIYVEYELHDNKSGVAANCPFSFRLAYGSELTTTFIKQYDTYAQFNGTGTSSGVTATGKYSLVLDAPESGSKYIATSAQGGGTGAMCKISVHHLYITKDDNWQEWIGKCGFTHATLDEVLSDASALETLMNDAEAVKYMIYNCTGTVASGCIHSQTAVDIIAESQYLDMILANTHWKKFLDMIGFAPRTYLYNEGDECEDLTGGWTKLKGVNATTYGTMTKNATNIYIKGPGTALSNGESGITATQKIDLTNYNSLKLRVSEMTQGHNAQICFVAIGNYADNYTSIVANIGVHTATDSIALDVSAITGSYYIYVVGSSCGGSLYVHKIWLE